MYNFRTLMEETAQAQNIEPTREETPRAEALICEKNVLDIYFDAVATSGENFFHSLVKKLAHATGADSALICEVLPDQLSRVRSLAVLRAGEFVDNFEVDIPVLCCLNAQEICPLCYPDQMSDSPLKPQAQVLGMGNYVGIPLIGQGGKLLGTMALMWLRQSEDHRESKLLLQILAYRVANEMGRLRSSEPQTEKIQFLLAMADAIPTPIFYKDRSGYYLGCNQAFERLFDTTRTEIVGSAPHDIAPKHLAPKFHEMDKALLKNRTPQTFETTIPLPDGRHRDVIINKAVISEPDGSIGGIVGTILDITDLRKADRKIQQLAYYDSLTGLPNRVKFKEHLSEQLADQASLQYPPSVLLIDLWRFKGLNGTLGHSRSNQILTAVAEKLANLAHSKDMVARVGRDEFAMTLHRGGEQEASRTSERILELLENPIKIQGQQVQVAASIGIALSSMNGEGADDLIENAEAAVFQAKEKGKNSYHFFSKQMNEEALEQLVLETQLRQALRREELHLCYQPQLDLSTGRTVGLEALVRWTHPTQGLVPPDRFIPIAENSGLILPIGEWVLRTACIQARKWQQFGHPGLRVSVNLSGIQLKQPRLVETVSSILQECRLDPNLLELELTESTMMEDTEENIQILNRLKGLGIHLSIDDFGTGFSSLSYLKRFPIDKLKIDRSFLSEVPHSDDDVAITKAVIALGHSLGLKVIAEGVETQEQLDFLRIQKCDSIQGYFFSRPLSQAGVDDFLKKEGPRRRLFTRPNGPVWAI